jgi:transposase
MYTTGGCILSRYGEDHNAEKKEIFALLVAGEGRSVKEAAGDPRLNISVPTAYKWSHETSVKLQMQAILRENKRRVQIEASKHITDALGILVKAMHSP